MSIINTKLTFEEPKRSQQINSALIQRKSELDRKDAL